MPVISLKKLAKILNVDFVLQISCGCCGGDDVDILTFDNWTKVNIECNKCMKENEIDLNLITEGGC